MAGACASVTALALVGTGSLRADDPRHIVVVPGGRVAPAAAPSKPLPAAAPVGSNAVTITPVTGYVLENPWALVFLPDGRLLVTERPGRLRIVTQAGQVSAAVAGVPAVSFKSQGGLLDVALDPDFVTNRHIWLSYAEPGSSGASLAVMRATLTLAADGNGRLDDQQVIWRQMPRGAATEAHFGGRIAFSPDGKLFVTAGEHQQEAMAQSLANTFGKIIRLNRDGSVPADNPYVGRRKAMPEIWSIGHRNPYGLVFGLNGRLYESEMGPAGGDEFNLIRARNFGWPLMSEGDRYSSEGGAPYPRHSTDPSKIAPLLSWTPVIAPGGMIQYTGRLFRGWNRDFVLAGLASKALIRVRVTQTRATEIGRVAMPARIREVEQAPDGSLWVVEDQRKARLIRVTPG
ncbi:PQQ-dependent sugar dehydrogenase [Sphingomonas radiodurans]|uniref:PQQ-dependent sugar dehydrogenase n=1 Tax=Sphingomonas radiodurans TaxID=2890321 RepID=UPI001E4F5689|nr:PQQ-dependent sugar dehydrogenase [Sphingomonas radiodurans]WBH17078.1 PQQ-dependent sugar dehydrogenase [Sphingomonas radiodurans]